MRTAPGVVEAVLASSESDCPPQYPAPIHLEIANEMLNSRVRDVPAPVAHSCEATDELCLAAHRVAASAGTDRRVKAEPLRNDLRAHSHVGPIDGSGNCGPRLHSWS